MTQINHNIKYHKWAVTAIEDQVEINCRSTSLKVPIKYTEWVDHFETYLYFVVVTLRPYILTHQNMKSKGFSAETCKSEFRNYYKNICRNLIGPRWDRKQALQPFAFCCLDAEGTYGNNRNPINWKVAKNIHINGLFLAHPEADPQSLGLNWQAAIPSYSKIDSVHASTYDTKRGTVENLAKYVCKADQPHSDQPVQLLILPEGKNRDRRTKALQNRVNRKTHMIQMQCPGGTDCPLRGFTMQQHPCV